MPSAIIVGSGPNGLAAALTLAAGGVDVTVLEASDSIGGGTRSGESTLPGLLHDQCSGFHPLAVDTGFSRQFDLESHGVRWALPEVQYSHPLDGGRGAAVWRSVDRTATHLGTDGDSYRRMFGPLTERFPDIVTEFL
ncbi:MAG TPA: FAD-dependent oxidoreductase, partial [Dietzia sp.]|nr:FAD-dependent oxidoreductase [Dietzia sp.]